MRKTISVSLAAVVIAAFPLVGHNPYYLRLATTVALYVILASGLNIQVGLAGLLDMGYVAFYAVGAYTYALLSSPQIGIHLTPVVALGAGVAAAVAFSLVVGLPTLRLHGDYLAIVTLGFAEIVQILLQNLDHPVNITNGPNGIIGIHPIRIGSFSIDSPLANYYMMAILAAAAFIIYVIVARSRLGLELRALKDDALAASSFGIDTSRARVTAFALGAAYAGIAGALFASWQGAVFPQNFTMNELIALYCMIILGGAGNPTGSLLGIMTMTLLPEALRSYASYRMLFYGLSLVAMMLYRPEGILRAEDRHGNAEGGALGEETDEAVSAPTVSTPDPGGSSLPVLEVKELKKHFGGLVALDDVSFRLMPGQVLGIIGPNGAGKTTLLNVLTGVTPPTSGQCYLGRHRLDGLKPHSIYNLGLTRTFQNLRLWKGLSVLENVAIGLNGSQATSRNRALDALKSIDPELARRSGEPAANLSYAAAKRLEMARAIAPNPSVVLLDEPAAGMNSREISLLRNEILELKQKGHAVILVEHRMPLVMGVSDSIVVLDHGKKIAEGTPAEVSANIGVTRAYLGTGDQGMDHQGAWDQLALAQLGANATVSEPLLRVQGLTVSYGPVRALNGIDMQVVRGEIVCVLGNNGAGKTTAIRTILGAMKPVEGKILLKDVDITGADPASVIRRGIAVVPEGRRVFARMTVEDNLLTGSYGAKGNSTAQRDALDYVYSLFGLLKERRHQKAGTLSGGEQQMLAIGRALMASPELLLLDEPSMGLAPIMVDRIFQVILDLNRNGTTVLMVEQNAMKALQIAQRGYVLQNGHIVQSGTSRELLESPNLHEAYLGTCGFLREEAANM